VEPFSFWQRYSWKLPNTIAGGNYLMPFLAVLMFHFPKQLNSVFAPISLF
jgi:hypothetical protein